MPFRVSIDGLLVDLNIFRLSLRDFDLGLELGWVGHASQIIAEFSPADRLDRQLLQHAGHAGSHMQRLDLVRL